MPLGIPGDVGKWLTRRLTASQIAEVRSKYAATNLKPTRFNHLDERFIAFAGRLDDLAEGDEVWEFRRRTETWHALGGRAGFCILCDGNVVAILTTALN